MECKYEKKDVCVIYDLKPGKVCETCLMKGATNEKLK